jgi:hypothetical protein
LLAGFFISRLIARILPELLPLTNTSTPTNRRTAVTALYLLRCVSQSLRPTALPRASVFEEINDLLGQLHDARKSFEGQFGVRHTRKQFPRQHALKRHTSETFSMNDCLPTLELSSSAVTILFSGIRKKCPILQIIRHLQNQAILIPTPPFQHS